VILENHLHLVASSDNIGASMTKIKKYAARQIIDLLKSNNAKPYLTN